MKNYTCKDMIDGLTEIDKNVFPFLSMDETEMVVYFWAGKHAAVEKYLKAHKLKYRFDSKRKSIVYIKIKRAGVLDVSKNN